MNEEEARREFERLVDDPWIRRMLEEGANAESVLEAAEAAMQRESTDRMALVKDSPVADQESGLAAIRQMIVEAIAEAGTPPPLDPPDPPEVDDGYLPAEPPSKCAKRMSKHLDTVKRYIDNGKLRCEKVTARSWRLHREDARKLGGKVD